MNSRLNDEFAIEADLRSIELNILQENATKNQILLTI